MISRIYKHVFLAGCIIIIAIILMLLLALFSNRRINQKNGFTRTFLNHPVSQVHHVAINDSIRSIAGISGNLIYFDTRTPGYIFQTDSNLLSGHFINLVLKKDKALHSFFTTLIDSSFVYIMAGNVPAVIVMDLNTKDRSVYHYGKILFTRAATINNHVFILRGYKKANGSWEQIFYKVDFATNIITEQGNISARTHDGGFSTDGLLHYDKTSGKLVFVNYYSNHFICMDTNMQLVYKSRTIDTVSTYQAVANIAGSGSYQRITNVSPIRDVNLQSCVSDGYLFINSALEADNESRNSFINNSVIDVYTISSGAYKGSFYIPLFKGERLKEFSVMGDRLIVLYKGYVVIYIMPVVKR